MHEHQDLKTVSSQVLTRCLFNYACQHEFCYEKCCCRFTPVSNNLKSRIIIRMFLLSPQIFVNPDNSSVVL
ncbi:hypothetical protein FB99_02870 [Pantoea agglomerans]|nr:hypothetical protein FB99_02870 [Pantoea agglomerans]